MYILLEGNTYRRLLELENITEDLLCLIKVDLLEQADCKLESLQRPEFNRN
jgi:hypothetical protein